MHFLRQHARSAESLAGKLEKSRFLLVGGFTILYFVSAYVLAARRLMWNDELYTYYIARLPAMADVWAALMAGGEQSPPFFYVVTRASFALFGINNLALRLPEIIGFWVMSLCLFVFVARRTTNFYGLLAAIFPLVTSAYFYAYEARPYGLVLGFGALALLCWQSATIDRFRQLSILCLALSLAGALSSHYYGIFVIFPLALGEAARTATRRRLDPPVWAAFGAAITPLLLWHLPLLEQARAYAGTFWAQPQWLGIPDFYYDLLAPAVMPLVAMLFLAGIYVAIFRAAGPAQNGEPGFAPPVHEIAAAFGFIVIPVICVVLAMLVTGAFTDRYAIPAVIGFSVLVAFIAARLFDNTALMAAALVICFVGWFGILELKLIRWVSDDSLGAAVKLLQSESEGGLPIVASDPHTFIELAHYAPPEISSRLVYLADPPASLLRLGHNSVERGMVDLLKPWFKLNVTDYQSYVAARPRFLVYGNLGFLSWIMLELKEDGMRIELRGRSGNNFLFSVYPDDQVAGLSEPEAALIDAAMKGDTQRVKDLLDRTGVKVNMKDAQGTTLLALAAWFGHTDTAKLLIERGADVNARKSSDDSSVLALATMKGHKYIVSLLLDKGVNVNVKDTQGATPLALAAWLGHTDIAKLLIERGADVNAKKSSSDDSSVLALATIKGHKDIAELLKKAGAK